MKCGRIATSSVLSINNSDTRTIRSKHDFLPTFLSLSFSLSLYYFLSLSLTLYLVSSMAVRRLRVKEGTFYHFKSETKPCNGSSQNEIAQTGVYVIRGGRPRKNVPRGTRRRPLRTVRSKKKKKIKIKIEIFPDARVHARRRGASGRLRVTGGKRRVL